MEWELVWLVSVGSTIFDSSAMYQTPIVLNHCHLVVIMRLDIGCNFCGRGTGCHDTVYDVHRADSRAGGKDHLLRRYCGCNIVIGDVNKAIVGWRDAGRCCNGGRRGGRRRE